MKVLVLHAYSADNLGDGLLVEETLALVRKALGDNIEVTVLASHPETFAGISATVISSAPSWLGYSTDYIRTLRRVGDFDLVVGVGGGYLRAGNLLEGLKTLAVHGPQLAAAAACGTKAIYLPQSIGPISAGLRHVVASRLKRIQCVMIRDDRSLEEFHQVGAMRVPDLAAGEVAGPIPGRAVESVPVLSVRAVRGSVPDRLYSLAAELPQFDMYVQSTSGGNDDRPATDTFPKRRILSRAELLAGPNGPIRVVIAVRLHAALMALRAGHYVVHLAYERKGFGAFSDLGLSDYVHNVNSFSVSDVRAQIQDLMNEASVRDAYRAALDGSKLYRMRAREDCIETIRTIAQGAKAN
ncbi:polysaccharide pyruvyl transferase family protein [Arthrobacter sp. USHLN218]|uniref:polysaccharide pyruvyl transferase family protein n=1 Tax=Arthrobacter sp. USHLN218 TaxID=3081232 RepID=UPI003FA56737